MEYGCLSLSDIMRVTSFQNPKRSDVGNLSLSWHHWTKTSHCEALSALILKGYLFWWNQMSKVYEWKHLDMENTLLIKFGWKQGVTNCTIATLPNLMFSFPFQPQMTIISVISTSNNIIINKIYAWNRTQTLSKKNSHHFVNLFFKASPVDYGINLQYIFAEIELSYDTKNKWQLQLRCFLRKVHQHFPRQWPKQPWWSKVVPLYGIKMY